jgi:hypothetical protein
MFCPEVFSQSGMEAGVGVGAGVGVDIGIKVCVGLGVRDARVGVGNSVGVVVVVGVGVVAKSAVEVEVGRVGIDPTFMKLNRIANTNIAANNATAIISIVDRLIL